MSSAVRRLGLVLSMATMIGCAAKGSYPANLQTRSLLDGEATADDREVDRLLAANPRLPISPRAALVVLGPTGLAESDRAALDDRLRAELDQPPFAAVELLPTSLTARDERNWLPTLANMRTAAARMQSDVLIVANTAADTDTGTNALSVAYFAVIPMVFVPGSEVGAWASAEACAIDVRSGLIVGCANGHGSAHDGYVIMTNTGEVRRELARDAVAAALTALPDRISEVVHRRISLARVESPHALRGVRYDTAGANP